MRLPIRLFALITTALLCVLPDSHGAEGPADANKRPQPDRWLLIVDTSSAMERRAKAVEGVVGELIVSGMNGQMQPGAELGIWTYNKELYAGVAPMQTWDPARSNLMANRTVGFLSKQTYRSKSQTEPVLSELARVVSDSRRLTVVWLSDGTGEKIVGTPFDAQINEAFTKYRPALSKTRMPLVTVLRVYHGKYIGQNISVAPWPIEFPPFPSEPAATNAVAKTATPTAPVKSIFISREPAKVEKPVEAPAAAQMRPDSVQLRPAPEGATNPPATTPAPVELAQPMPAAVVQPAPVVAPVEPPPAPKPAAPKPVEVAAVAPKPEIVAPVSPAPAPAAVAPQPTPVTATAAPVASRKWPLILGISFMWVAIFAALTLARRARRAKATSLITRSFDRDKQ
jgi:hypothetical protein